MRVGELHNLATLLFSEPCGRTPNSTPRVSESRQNRADACSMLTLDFQEIRESGSGLRFVRFSGMLLYRFQKLFRIARIAGLTPILVLDL